MLLLWRPRVFPKATAERDTVAGKLVETVPRHALLLLLLLLWGHVVFLKCIPISPGASGVLWWSFQVRLEFSLRVEASGAVSILGALLLCRWWLRSSDLEANVVDGLPDHDHHLVPLVHKLLKPGVPGRRGADIPLKNHQGHHEQSPPEDHQFQRRHAPAQKQPHVSKAVWLPRLLKTEKTKLIPQKLAVKCL